MHSATSCVMFFDELSAVTTHFVLLNCMIDVLVYVVPSNPWELENRPSMFPGWMM